MPTKIEISYKTILFTFGILGLLWLLWQIQEIILILYLVFILMSALRPLVESLERFRIPRVFSILFIYAIFISLLGFVGGAVVPPFVAQTIRFWQRLPEILGQVIPTISLDWGFVGRELTPVGGNILRLSLGIFSNIISLVTFLVLTFYFLLERKRLDETFSGLFGLEVKQKIIKVLAKIEERLGSWVRGQLILMIVIGVASYIGLTLLGIDYALPLAITAGFLEIIPIAGPIISGVPAVLVALTVSPALGLAVVALYFIIQQLENHLLVPTVMRKTVGLAPVVTLVALMIGGKLGGIAGALLAVPTVLIIQTIINEVALQKDPKNS